MTLRVTHATESSSQTFDSAVIAGLRYHPRLKWRITIVLLDKKILTNLQIIKLIFSKTILKQYQKKVSQFVP